MNAPSLWSCWTSSFCLVVLLLGVAWQSVVASESEELPPLDKNNGTWHLQFEGLFGSGVKRGNEFFKNLDMYPTFVDGALVNALATARTFNTSIHPMLESSVVVDSTTNTLGGELVVLLTPDSWVPKHGKSTPIRLTLDGSIAVTDESISIARQLYRDASRR